MNESDWKLFRTRLPIWREAYMTRVVQEYIGLLSSDGAASDKFCELEKRMREDKERCGVVMRMSRSYMDLNIMHLLQEGVIALTDLDGFSDEFREKMAF